MISFNSRNTILFLLQLFLFAQLLAAQSKIKEKSIESLKKIFGDSISLSRKQILLSPKEKSAILEQAKTQWKSDTVEVYICAAHDTIAGYGFVDDVKGKVQNITYLVAINASGEVRDIDILAYRESYGGEIAYESFRKQFRNKSFSDQLVPGKDIKNISGATISVRSITMGVKRVLVTYELLKERLQ